MKGVALLCALWVLCGAMVGVCQTTEPSSQPSSRPSMDSPMKVDAVDLRAAYRKNGAAANAVYGGRDLCVIGKVRKIPLTPEGTRS